MPLVLGVTLVTSVTKKSHIKPKYMKIMIELGKYRKTKTMINNTLLHDFKKGFRLIMPNNYLLVKVSISNVQKKRKKICLRVCRYRTASFRGYFLGARNVLHILLKSLPMEWSLEGRIRALFWISCSLNEKYCLIHPKIWKETLKIKLLSWNPHPHTT